MYWRRAISGLANPYLRALSVFGLGALPLSQVRNSGAILAQ